MVKLALFMLRKGISKKKLLLNLNMMMKRGKTVFTGKVSTTHGGFVGGGDAFQEYEFSCSNTPLYHHYFTNKKKSHHHQSYYYYGPSPEIIDDGGDINLEAINKVLDTVFSSKIRVTDSPFPLQNEEDFDDQRVDEAAEEFIKRFYSQLKEQNYY
ncbi:hypothetical protein SOVF_212130, partial [Spinacia oleracea]|uniref:Uncharacterized protein n=1 Tax=Spinacia oleracea TaxID=3562 RepID=A0A9R0HSF4_SPIOL